jgi:hypothetical protein
MHEERLCAPHLDADWRIASRNGSDSMSPTVPPISTMQTSASPAPSLIARLISSVMCGSPARSRRDIAAPLLADHALVDAASGEVAVAVRDRAHEALVVAEVEVGLAPSSVTNTSPCWNGLIVPGSTLM